MVTRRPGKPHPVQGQAGTSTLPAESQVGRRAARPAPRKRGRWMVVLDKIRLIGQLRKSPALAGLFYCLAVVGRGDFGVPVLGRRLRRREFPARETPKPPGPRDAAAHESLAPAALFLR